MNTFLSYKVAHQFAPGLSKRTFATLRSISTKPRTSIYLGGATALLSMIAWTSISSIDNEVDEKKIQEGKSIAQHTGSNEKEDEAKKEAVGRGNVKTKVPAEEGTPRTKSEAMSNEEADQTKQSLPGNLKEKPQKDSGGSEIKWTNQFLKPMASGKCGQEFKNAFSVLLSGSDLKGSDAVKKLEALRTCLKGHPEISKD